MILDLSKIDFSHNDAKRKIKIPKLLNEDLAHLIGIHVGDGNLSFEKKRHNYNINFTGHLYDEHDWYSNYLTPLIKELFNFDAKIKLDKRVGKNSLRIIFKSKAIFTLYNRTSKW